ncbi:MAG: XTP/dITP diphosphatase [bacterium]
MLTKIILATKNQDKIVEIKKLVSNLNLFVHTLNEFPNAPNVVEDGKTLEENAVKKAKIIGSFTKLPAVADDTGLEVEYLKGQPGVLSSRYAGEIATYAENVEKLLRELQGVPWEQRNATFRCVVALYNNSKICTVEGICKGVISEAPRGKGGFGYDPVFYVPEYNCTYAEMGLELKNKISHRGKAFLALKKLIESDQSILVSYQ